MTHSDSSPDSPPPSPAKSSRAAAPAPGGSEGWREWLARFSVLTAAGCGVVGLGGLTGHWHWLVDLIGNFAMQALATALASAITLAALRKRSAWLALAAAMLLALVVWPPRPAAQAGPAAEQDRAPAAAGANAADATAEPSGELRLMLANVLATAVGFEPLAVRAREFQPDVLIILELSRAARRQLAPLLEDFPHRHEVVASGSFGIGIYSRLPVVDREEAFYDPMAATLWSRVSLAGGRTVQIVATHPVPPISGAGAERRNRQLKKIGQLAGEVSEPLIVAGDLNCTPWSPHFKQLLRAGGLFDTGAALQPSWPAQLPPPLRIPIDHVLVSEHWSVRSREVGPAYASDHLPVTTVLKLKQQNNPQREQVRTR